MNLLLLFLFHNALPTQSTPIQDTSVIQLDTMPVTNTVKRWVISGKGDVYDHEATFQDFLEFLQSEQDFWVSCPGYLIEEPVPDTMEEWADISERIAGNPQPERLAKLEWFYQQMVYSGEPNAADESSMHYGPISWGTHIMRQNYGPEYNTKREFEYLPHDFQRDEPILLWALAIPTKGDKVMALSKVPRESQRGWPVVVHVAQFDDLMAGPDSELRTGYKIIHDILRDEIIITKIWFEVPEPGPKKWRQLHPRSIDEDWIRVPHETRWNDVEWIWVPQPKTRSFKAELSRNLLFRGSPAALADRILRGSPTRKIPTGFDLILRVISAEWLIENWVALRYVERPPGHRYTFTKELQEDLIYWRSLMDLSKHKFPNTWTRAMVDLKGFENQKKREKRKRKEAREAGKGKEIEAEKGEQMEAEAEAEKKAQREQSANETNKERETAAGLTRRVTMDADTKARRQAEMVEAEADLKARLEALRVEAEVQREADLETERLFVQIGFGTSAKATRLKTDEKCGSWILAEALREDQEEMNEDGGMEAERREALDRDPEADER